MSASVSLGPSITADDPQQVLAGWLDDYIAERCDLDDLNMTFVSVVKTNVEASWVALALLDQYQRLGRIDSSLATVLKTKINQLALGAPATLIASPLALSTTTRHTAKSETTRRSEIAAEPRVATPSSQVASEHHANARPRFGALGHATGAEPASAPPKRILRQRYELLELISSTATGKLYRALDRQRAGLPHAEQHVAVNVVRLDEAKAMVSPDEVWQGFYRAQSLTHPNIRSVFDVDRDGDTCFAVMELLDGELLSTLLQHSNWRPMPWRHIRGILQGIGAALTYAHDRGFVHGELRPENVMVTRTGEIKLLELGFTRLHHQEPWISDGATHPDVHDKLGRYSNLGQSDTLTPHTGDDVFNLACIAYELLSGRHPYDGQSATLARRPGHPPSRSAWFNQHQWRVLQRALRLNADHQTITVRELLAGLGCGQPTAAVVPLKALLANRIEWQPLLVGAGSLLIVALVAYILVTALPAKSSHGGGSTGTAGQQPRPLMSASSNASPDPARAISADAPAEADVPAMPVAVGSAPAADNDVFRSVPDINAGQLATTPFIPLAATTGDTASTQLTGTGLLQAKNAVRTTGPAGTVSFTQDSFVAFEDKGPARVVLRRTGRLNAASHVRWSLIGGSAKPGEDYADLPPGIAEIPAGTSEYTLMIPLASDAVPENTELFQVKIEALDDASQSPTTFTTDVIVVDDDKQ